MTEHLGRVKLVLFCTIYGSRAVLRDAYQMGFLMGERRVARLMAANGIKIVRTHKYKRITDSRHGFSFAQKLLKQAFEASAPNQKSVFDMSDVWTKEGWLYPALVIDLYSRKLIGWATSNRLKRDLAVSAHGHHAQEAAASLHSSLRSRVTIRFT